MDTQIFLIWFEEKVLPFTARRCFAATHVILILDSFSCHVHSFILHVARDSHIIKVGQPPHSTHITQPLDVGLMKPL
jgi:hypothetical protein